MCHGFSNFTGLLHHFVLGKLVTSSIRVNPIFSSTTDHVTVQRLGVPAKTVTLLPASVPARPMWKMSNATHAKKPTSTWTLSTLWAANGVSAMPTRENVRRHPILWPRQYLKTGSYRISFVFSIIRILSSGRVEDGE